MACLCIWLGKMYGGAVLILILPLQYGKGHFEQLLITLIVEASKDCYCLNPQLVAFGLTFTITWQEVATLAGGIALTCSCLQAFPVGLLALSKNEWPHSCVLASKA